MPSELVNTLSVELLRRISSGEAFARGARYYADRAVREVAVADLELTGVVAGAQQQHHVRLRLRDRRLEASCTCTGEGRVCKHVVALGLHVLARPRSVAEERPADRESSAGFASHQALDAWAAEHHVTHALAMPIEVVAATTRLVPRWVFTTRATLGTFAVDGRSGAASSFGLPPPAAAELARVVRARLDEEVAHVEAGLAEEAAHLARTPPPAVDAAWQLVLTARAAVRAGAVPRGAASRAAGTLSVVDRGEALRWSEPGHVVVTSWLSSAATATCSCHRHGSDPRCVHALAALDAALDRLFAGDATVAAVIATAPWQRLCEQLAGLDRPTAEADGGELWWRVSTALGFVTVDPVVRKRGKKGLSRGSRVHAVDLVHGYLPATPADREAARLLSAHGSHRAVQDALLVLRDHPRLVCDDRALTPLTVRRAELSIAAQPDGGDLRLVATAGGRAVRDELLDRVIRDPDATCIDHQPELGVCTVIDVDPRAVTVLRALRRHGDRVPPAGRAAVIERLLGLADRVPVALPAALLGDAWPTTPTVVLRLTLVPEGGLDLAAWIQLADDAPLVVPGEGRDVLPLARAERVGHLRRDLDREVALVHAAVAALPVAPTPDDTGPPWRYRVAALDDALTLAGALEAPPAGVRAEWLSRRPVVRRGATAAGLRLDVDERHDWFDVAGALELDDDRVELAAVLEAVRAQRRHVRLGPDRWLELADALRAQLAPLAAHRTRARGQDVTSMAAIPAVLDLAEAGATVGGSEAWTRLLRRARDAAHATPPVPAELAGVLRGYQRDGFTWMTRLAAWGAGGVLADDMGLGKTVQTIALLCARAAEGPALVIAPTSVCGNWQAELARFAPALAATVLAERDGRAAVIDEVGRGDVLIVSYALLVREGERLAGRRFATVVLDEAQAIKNHGTKRARAARALDAGFKVALTGTPLENRLAELWSIFAAVFPPLFGAWEHFRATYATPIERERDPAARDALARLLRPFVLRRRKAEVARELPPRTEVAVTIARSDEEVALYEEVRLAAIAKLDQRLPELGAEQQRIQILAELTKLRLAACHPRLHDPTSTVPSSKLARLLELVDELRAEGHRALVFSQFVAHLTLVRAALDEAGVSYQYLDGATAAVDRAARVAAFQRGDGDVFLISLKAGGVGLNLTGADYVIHLDPWWNPAVEDQASDRAHRIGQTRPVTIYRLVAEGTIEAKILALHAAKRDLAASILAGTDGALASSSAELLALLGGAPPGPVPRPRPSSASTPGPRPASASTPAPWPSSASTPAPSTRSPSARARAHRPTPAGTASRSGRIPIDDG